MAEKSEKLVTREEKVLQAQELYNRGSRHYVLKAYSEAADDLAQACTLLDELHGSIADELGLPYLLYAKSLVYVAQDENKVIEVPEEEEDDDDDEDDDAEEEDGSEETAEATAAGKKEADTPDDNKASNEAEKKVQKTAESVKEKNEAEKKTDESKIGKSNGDASSKLNENKIDSTVDACASSSSKTNGNIDSDQPSTSNGASTEKNGTAEEEDGETLQTAWEILELAAKIFERQGESALANLAEVYAELAGISFENSHFELAIDDYEKALQIQIKLPEDNRRIIAEIHFKIGLAHLMLNSFDKCVTELKAACTLIDQEIQAEKEKERQDDATKELIADLETTKQDIIAKIEEVEETKQQSTEEVKRELSKLIGTGIIPTMISADGSGPSSSSSSSAQAIVSSSSTLATEKPKATDISHLIKRKKPDTTATTEADCSPAKRPTS